MIRFGPAGIPLSCKGRTLKDGIEDVHNLGLSALEVQMVRTNIIERYPEEEEVGLTLSQLEGGLVVEIIRDDGAEDVSINDPEAEVDEDDILICMGSGVTNSYDDLLSIGRLAKQLDVSLSMHTPYYMDLATRNELSAKCIDAIRWSGFMTHALQGEIVVTHMGLYGGRGQRETAELVTESLADVMAWWEDNSISPLLGLEVSGRQEVFGSLDEVLEICDELDNVVPVINFPHYHAREGGALMEAADFADLFDRVHDYVGGRFHTHFAGVEHEGFNEKRLTPIKKGDLRFEPLAEALVDKKPEMTIISSSPLLEHDAMYMKVIHERVLTRRVVKALRKKGKAVADTASDYDDEYDDEEE